MLNMVQTNTDCCVNETMHSWSSKPNLLLPQFQDKSQITCHSNMDFQMNPESAFIELQDLEVAIIDLAPYILQKESRNLIRKYFQQICMLMIDLCKPGELFRKWHLEIYELLNLI